MLVQHAMPLATFPTVVPAPEECTTGNRGLLDYDAFPEDRFQPLPTDAPRYRAMVARGYRTMRTRRVVIAGLARDIGRLLPYTIARIERLGGLFADFRVVIYENDSNDSTAQRLREWSRMNSQVEVISVVRRDPVNPTTRCLDRAERMAYYRNQYHAHIESQYADYDDVLIVDTDLVGGWSYDGIANTYGHTDWDFVGSFGMMYRRIGWNPNRIVHYDTWAFRVDGTFSPMATEKVNYIGWARGTPMVPVSSCFGGLGIYRTHAFLSARYHSGDCEHIGLHRVMRQRGYDRTFINPSQMVLYGRRNRTFDRLVSTCQRIAATGGVLSAPVWL